MSTQAETVRIAVSGELDLASGPTLTRRIAHAERLRPRRIEVDLADLGFIDSAGLLVLVRAHARSQEQGHSFVIVGPRGQARRLLQLTGLEATLCPESDSSPSR